MSANDPQIERMQRARAALSEQDVSGSSKLLGFAMQVHDAADEAWDADVDRVYDMGDQAHEVADDVLPVYTNELLAIVTDDLGLLQRETEIGPAGDGTPTIVNIASSILYELAYELALARLRARDEESA